MPKITDPAALAALAVRKHNAKVVRAVKAATAETVEFHTTGGAPKDQINAVKFHGKAVVEAVKSALPE